MKNLWIIFLVFFLTACAIAPKQISENKSLQQRQKQLAEIKKFSINGQFSLVAPNTQVTGNLIWKQCDQNYQIQLFGPFGMGHVRIVGNQNQVMLQDSRNRKFTASNPETLMQQQLGWALPLTELQYWVKGQAASQLPSEHQVDNQSHLIELKQQNWIINYQNFQTVNHVDLPIKIRMQQGQVFSKMVIDEWKINLCEID